MDKKNIKTKMKKQVHIKTKKGFSLVEVLVALLVVSIGMVSISVLMSNNIKTSIENRNQIVAMQLAQEGVELVRNLKDNNYALFQAEINGTDYRIDNTFSYNGPSPSFKASNVANDPQKKLYLNNSGVFLHTGVTATKFLRKIQIVNDSTNKIITITSFVSWKDDGTFPSSPADCVTGSKCNQVSSVLPYTN